MRFLRKQIPSMFHRRLSLLLVVFAAVVSVLWGQLFRLTIVKGASLLAQAERRLIAREALPTVRVNILDRKGRLLATDRPVFEVRVDYKVITGQWAYEQARKLAMVDYRGSWGEMSFDEREALVAKYRPTYDEQLDRLWAMLARIGGVERDEIEKRKLQIIEKVQ